MTAHGRALSPAATATPSRVNQLHDAASLYTHGIAEVLFSEIAWQTDQGDPQALQDLFATGNDRATASGARGRGALRALALRSTIPAMGTRHAVTSVRVSDVDARSFRATAVAVVRTAGPRVERTDFADWSMTVVKTESGWRVQSFDTVMFADQRQAR